MAISAVKLGVVLLVGIVGAMVVVETMRNKPQVATAPRPSSSGPPADAEYLEDGPTVILMKVGRFRPEQQDAAATEFIGKWNGPEGWEGMVEGIDEEDGVPTLRLYCYSATTIGGGYWIAAHVGDDHGVKKGDTVSVQGKVARVGVRTGPAATVAAVIVLDDARIIR
jgi:hypothetical protein